MMMHAGGVHISAAEGGYLIEWMEAAKAEEEPGFLEQERRGPLEDCVQRYNHLRATPRRAVRVKLEDALKLAGEVLARGRAVGEDALDGPQDFTAAG